MKLFLIIFLVILFFVETKNLRELSPIEERYTKLKATPIKASLQKKNIFILDIRNNTISNLGYLPNSLLIPLTMSYSNVLRTLIEKGSNIILICDETNYKEALEQTEVLGQYTIVGYAIYNEIIKEGEIEIKIAEYNENTLKDVEKLVNKQKYLLDIREIYQYKQTGVIKGSHLIPFSTFKTKYKNIPNNDDIYIFCKGGGGALSVMSFLQRAGYTFKLVVMRGGITKTIKEGYPLVPYSE